MGLSDRLTAMPALLVVSGRQRRFRDGEAERFGGSEADTGSRRSALFRGGGERRQFINVARIVS